MKKLLIIFLLFAIASIGCKKSFLDLRSTQANLNDAYNKAGVQLLLTAAYHDLTGYTIKSGYWSTSGTNWIYGDITSGDAYRGGASGFDVEDGLTIEHFQAVSSTGYLADKWRTVYDGVVRCNKVLRAVNYATDITQAEKTTAMAEARFLRGHFHFEAKKMWNKVPFIDEKIDSLYEKDFSAVQLTNDVDIWPAIEADFTYAMDNLPETQSEKARANKWAAACYLAKAYMFEKKFTEAKALLNTIIPPTYGGAGNGVTSHGQSYALMPNFDDNFNGATENGPEHVFQIQFSANDGSNGGNANVGEIANTPAVYPLSSYYLTWKQPTFNLVNAYKTDVNGLPMIDEYNDLNMDNDAGLASYDYFYPYQGTIDPRLDWTVGRRGVPYLDWTDPTYSTGTYFPSNPGSYWINDQSFGGPYLPVKNMFRYSDGNYLKYSENYAQYYMLTSATNVSIIRFADVLLWAAECEAELSNYEKAREFVNYVRNRAKTGRYVNVEYTEYSGYNASANYLVDEYNTPWSDQIAARKAIRFERRLELALEGHRFFDLVRWGVAGEFLNNQYLAVEKTRLPLNLNGVTFTEGKNEYFPIPQNEIDLNPKLKQNPGY